MLKLQGKPSGRRLTRLWVFAFIVLTVGTAWVMLTTQPPDAEIPFSFFADQVRADNVTQVHIFGDQIVGSFANAIRWSPESNAPTADAAAIYPPGTYASFTTLLPEGNALLMPFLAQHGVQVVAAPPPIGWFMILLRTGLPIALMLTVAAWIVHLAAISPRPAAVPVR